MKAFVSYARVDAERVEALCADLEELCSATPWIDRAMTHIPLAELRGQGVSVTSMGFVRIGTAHRLMVALGRRQNAAVVEMLRAVRRACEAELGT